jgi:hypothetical protein
MMRMLMRTAVGLCLAMGLALGPVSAAWATVVISGATQGAVERGVAILRSQGYECESPSQGANGWAAFCS